MKNPQEENNTKLKHINQVADDGRLEHLLHREAGIKSKIHDLASGVLKHNVEPDSEHEHLQSNIGIFRTLVVETFKTAFPEYYHPSKSVA